MLLLVIDDDPEDREIFCEAVDIINPKIKCVSADDGEHAIEYLQNAIALPDIIFLDVNMPKMNGLQTLTAIRKVKALKDIPVVIYSTAAPTGEMRSFEKLGSVFIKKPPSFIDLIDSLRTIIGIHIGWVSVGVLITC